MALLGTLASLSQTPASNAADGSADAPSTIDNQINILASYAAQLRDGVGFTVPTSLRNKLINGNFAINQRSVSGSVVLAANAYGHDRWRANASGCSYTFAAGAVDTVVTVTSGVLLQLVEPANVEGGNYVLSWVGTAQANINGGTSGPSPQTVSGIAAGGALSAQFGVGTVSQVMLTPGTVATPFERRPIGLEQSLCERYYLRHAVGFQASVATGATYGGATQLRATMRTNPTVNFLVDSALSGFPAGSLATAVIGPGWVNFSKIANGTTTNGYYYSLIECIAEI